MISKEEVKHIAKLARLELTDEEITKMQTDMSAILDYFDLLKRAPKPDEQPTFIKDYGGRRDEVVSSYEIKDKIIAQAPDKKDDYIKVKNIF